ncbi:MAG: protein kinase, partial [Verrucomicrobiota bacterium]
MNEINASSKLEARYQFITRLSEGGMGEVSTAWDTQLKRTVAIKRMKAGGMELVQGTLQEAMRMASIRHPNIVTVYDIGMDEGTPYIVMEFVNGETLEERVEKAVIGIDLFVDIAQQTFNGLIAAHHSGLIHRDLKPSNIMLTALSSGVIQVKILDFGMAKFLSTPTAQTTNIDGSITGSVSWISPEQLNRETVDARSDLYSLGCVFYYALSGIRPFDGVTTSETLTAHLMQKVVPLETQRPDLPPMICQWVMALINRLPENRYQSSMEALSALLSIAPQGQNTPVTPTTGTCRSESDDKTFPARISGPKARTPFRAQTQATTTVPMPASGTGPAPHEHRFPDAAPLPFIRPNPGPAIIPTTSIRQKQGIWLPLIGVGVFLMLFLSIGLSCFLIFERLKNEPLHSRSLASPPSDAPKSEQNVDAFAEAEKSIAAMPAASPVLSPAPTPSAVADVPVESSSTASSAAIPAKIVFRVHGSNTIGAKLLPALMEEFLRQEGATLIHRNQGNDPEESTIEATLPGDSAPKSFEIAAHGSKTAFEDLALGKCDIGISSRAIKADESDACTKTGLGDMRSPACEHVVGLDGIAILVNYANPINGLTKQQIADLFMGKISDWSQIGGTAGPVHLYARDSKSGTFDTFKSLVLGTGTDLSPEAKRFEDSNALSDSVAADPNGIGFVGLPFVHDAKAIAVSEPGTLPLMATPFTVATEDYLLARRLYVYTPANPQNPMTRKFIEFALGDHGQEIVSTTGFVKQTPDIQHPSLPDNAPRDYTSAVKDAERLSLNFRFRPNSTDLDNKSIRDLDRIAHLLLQNGFKDRGLLLFGFADGKGAAGVNLKLSRERAQSVAKELATRGISPT